MENWFQPIVANIEPIADSIYGPLYRCALTLKDGTHLPCAVLQSKTKRIELAKRRISEEISGKGKIGGPDPFGQLLAVLVAGGNRVNNYDVASASPSKYAPPPGLLRQIHGETLMGWTGWVFEMKDGKLFQYGSSFRMEFLSLPDGYSFDDVIKVHNHSYLSQSGTLAGLERGRIPSADYDRASVFRELVFFECYIDGI